MEDAKTAQFWKVQYNIIRSHTIVLSKHTMGFPYMLAGLAHEERSECLATLSLLRRFNEAYEVEKQRAELDIKALVRGCPLQCAVPKMACLFGQSAGEQEVSEQLDSLVASILFGPGHTKLVGDTIQKLRDLESRDGSGKRMARFQALERAGGRQGARDVWHPEVGLEHELCLPESWAPSDSKSMATHSSDGSKNGVPLMGIIGQQSWTTYTSQTVGRHMGS